MGEIGLVTPTIDLFRKLHKTALCLGITATGRMSSSYIQTKCSHVYFAKEIWVGVTKP